MSNIGCKISHRFLAAVLAVLMIFSMMPLTVVNADSTESFDVFTITVTDGENPIKGATVKVFNDSEDLYIAADPEDPESQEQDYRFSYDDLTTDENGVVAIADITALSAELEAIGIHSFTVNYEVTMTDFENASGSVEVTLENATSLNVDVELVSTLITDVTIEGNSYVYDGDEKELVSVTKIEGDTVEYYLNGATDPVAEVPTATDVGTYSVRVIVTREGYQPFESIVESVIEPADIEGIEIAPVTDLKYNGEGQELVTFTGEFAEGDEVTWTVNGNKEAEWIVGENDDVETAIPKRIAVGSYAVTLTVNRGANYNKFEKTVDVEIALAELDLGDLKIEAINRTYDATEKPLLDVTKDGDYTLEYSTDEKATWVKDTIPVGTDADEYVIYVKATKEGYNEKNTVAFPITVTISQAAQSFDFENYDAMEDDSNPEDIKLKGSVPYSQTYEFFATDTAALAGGTITYEIVADENVATITADGVLTVNRPGAITVIAKLSGNKNYKECEIRYYLNVTGSVSANGQYIEFAEAEKNFVIGTDSTISDQKADKKDRWIFGDISYSINDIEGVAIDPASGKLTVTDIDELVREVRTGNNVITVTAKKAATRWYDADEISYKVNVSFETTPADPYTLSTEDGTNGWYKTKATVIPVAGYTIAQNAGDDFAESTDFCDQGTDVRYVYLKNTTTGGITDRIVVNVKIDSETPTNLKIEFAELNFIQKIGQFLGFYNPDITITFTAEDVTSGIDHFAWTYTPESGTPVTEQVDVTVSGNTARATITLPADEAEQLHGTISFTATDKANNVFGIDDDYVFIVDTIAPELSVKYQGEEPYTAQQNTYNGAHFFNSDVVVELTITETNFYAEDVVVMVSKDNGTATAVTPSWNGKIGTFTLAGDGDYFVYVTYTDKSDNTMAAYTSEVITVDKTAPVVKIDYVHNDDAQTVIFTVIEHNFRAGDVTVSDDSVFKDINGNPLSINAESLTEILRTAEWKQDESNKDKYTFAYDELPNGRYDIKLDYVDIVKRTTYDEEYFIVDHNGPTDVSIEYLTTPIQTFASVVTLGFYNPSVEVKFTAYDTSAGVKSFTWSYTKAEGASDKQTDDILPSEKTTVAADPDKDDPSKFTATITLTAEQYGQLKGNLAVYATDDYNNQSEITVDSGKVIVVDTVSPKVTVFYTPADRPVEETKNYYYKGDIQAWINVDESNFFEEDVVVKVSRDGAEATAVVPKWCDVSVDEHIGTFTLSGDGDYVVYVEYKDRSYKDLSKYSDSENYTIATHTSETLTIDTTPPKLEFSFDQKAQTTTFTVTEHNFFADGITVKGSIKDITGKDLAFSPAVLTEVLRNAEWTKVGDVYTFEYDYRPDNSYANGIYDLRIDVEDLATNPASPESGSFVIDHAAPTPVEITYSQPITETFIEVVTLGFYNPDVTVTFTAHDYASGVQSFAYKYTKEAGASDVNRDTDKEYTVITANQDVEDRSKFTATITLPKKDAEQLRGYFSALATDKYGNNKPDDEVVDQNNVIIVDTKAPKMSVAYNAPITTIDTTHYYNGDVTATFTVTEANFFAEDVKVKVTKDGGAPYEVSPTWKNESVDLHIGTYTLTGDGDYVVYVEYKDRSYKDRSEYPDSENYEIATHTSETLMIDTTAPILDFSFDQTTQTTTFTVIEHNFRASDITVTGNIGDITGAPIQHTGETITNVLHNAQWTQNGDTYTYVYDYSVGAGFASGIYDLTISYEDICKNSDTIEPETFIIDHDAPTEVTIEYSQSLMDTVLETLTLGFYNPNVTITFTAYDLASGVQSFAYTYTKEAGASDVNRNTDTQATVLTAVQDINNSSKFTASDTLPAEQAEQLRGYISVVATDAYSNSADEVADNDYIVIVDTISPAITVEYSAPDRVVDATSYYNGDIEVTFTVTEANFFAEDVNVMISKDGGSAESISPEWTDTDVNVHVGKYTITGDGDYVVTVSYTDRSNNEMVQYTSDIMTIDTILPVISVDYQNKNIINTLLDRDNNNREYYDNTQTLVVTITEHNFLPGEVEFTITATDVAGNTLDVNSLHTKENAWTSNGDVHTLTITFPGDANYSFDVAYTDLATNVAEDYEVDYFTVDKTAPENIKVEYSAGVLETVLESVTFGFYNAKMTVTITADDSISGVHSFVYSYLNAEGVSGVNAELVNQAISAANIEYSNDGKTAKVSFEIPKMILDDDNQFNGTVSFTVSDRANKTTEKNESKRIVVDNIAPTARVTYNEAANVVDGVSYYNGDINVTITVNEANFYSEDVVVLVSKDHGAATAITPTWSDTSVDIHVGAFTLTEDGDYVITINYEDKSTNKMTEYTSKQLTIDTIIEAPTYEVNGVKKEEIGGAYKNDATISFNYEDQNFDVKTIKLVKTRFDKVEDVTEQFISVTDNANGGFGSFTIPEEVDNDGMYVLTISMNDKAKHNIESQMKFTINRFGSVYEYGEALVNLIKDGGQYVTSVDDEILITEYNADRIIEDSLNILITRDGQSLDAEYSSTADAAGSNVNVGESGWYEYVYTIDPSNFTEDGVYKITITSKYKTDDEESNDSASVPENSIDSEGNQILDTMTFIVDKTVPEIRNIVNLDKTIVNAQSLDVKFTIVDVGGLKAIEIILSGETIDTITEFGDGQFNYSGQFTIDESSEAQTVQIKVTDLAGNVTDTASENFSTGDLYIFNDRVTVSTNLFVRWYANKPLFWGAIGGVVVAAAAVCITVALKRKKKAEAE